MRIFYRASASSRSTNTDYQTAFRYRQYIFLFSSVSPKEQLLHNLVRTFSIFFFRYQIFRVIVGVPNGKKCSGRIRNAQRPRVQWDKFVELLFFCLQNTMNKEREHRRTWTDEEDQTLREAVATIKSHTRPKWKEIAIYLNQKLKQDFPRNAKQCRERYVNALAPNSKTNSPWCKQDDICLIRACKKYGHRWAQLVHQFGGSSNDNRLKNHFYSNLRKIVRHINTVVKEEKRNYQQRIKRGEQISEEEEEQMKNLMKVRTFELKYLSKVFSLIDSKQQFKYQAQQTLSTDDIQKVNDQILDLMEDYVSERNEFEKQDLFELIFKIMFINRSVKIKYTRESKMSLVNQDEVQKENQRKKKMEKKLSMMIKEELENKIIPDKRVKEELIQKIANDGKIKRRALRPCGELGMLQKSTKKTTGNYSMDEEISERDQEYSDEESEKQNQNSQSYQKNHSKEEQNMEEEKQEMKQSRTPFQSGFLNNIPIASKPDSSGNDESKKRQSNGFQYNEVPGLFNTCQQREPENQKSRPLNASELFTFEPNIYKRTSTFNVPQVEENSNGQNKREAFFESMQLDKMSENSDKMKNSFCDLVQDLNPMHVSAFQPPKDNRDGGGLLDASQPFTKMMLLDSQPFYGDFMSLSGDLRRKNSILMHSMAQSHSYNQDNQDNKGNQYEKKQQV